MIKHENETTVTFNSAADQQTTFASIEIFYQGKAHSVAEERLPFTVGRDLEKCDLVLDDKLVSREHFALLLRDGLMGLTDMSTNGTWVQLGRSEAVQVKNSFLPLIGSGIIRAGSEIRNDDKSCLHFKVIYA